MRIIKALLLIVMMSMAVLDFALAALTKEGTPDEVGHEADQGPRPQAGVTAAGCDNRGVCPKQVPRGDTDGPRIQTADSLIEPRAQPSEPAAAQPATKAK